MTVSTTGQSCINPVLYSGYWGKYDGIYSPVLRHSIKSMYFTAWEFLNSFWDSNIKNCTLTGTKKNDGAISEISDRDALELQAVDVKVWRQMLIRARKVTSENKQVNRTLLERSEHKFYQYVFETITKALSTFPCQWTTPLTCISSAVIRYSAW